MRKLRIATVVVLGVVFAFGLTARAGADCNTYTNHSGHVPGSYDFAKFYEDGRLVVTLETGGQDIYVNPRGYDAGRTWDKVKKCHYPTTTTTVQETTTTWETTTTTEATTTTQPTTTTTNPTTTTYPTSTTTTSPGETTSSSTPPTTVTTQPPSVTTPPANECDADSTADECLPFTGAEDNPWDWWPLPTAVVLSGLGVLGVSLRYARD